MVAVQLADPTAAMVDNTIYSLRSTYRSHIGCFVIVEAILIGLFFMSSFHLMLITGYCVLVLGAMLCVITTRQCWSDRDLERRRLWNRIGPMTIVEIMYYGRYLQVVMCPTAIVEVGLWVHRHGKERSDRGGIIASAVVAGLLLLSTIYLLYQLYHLLQVCKIDQRMTFAQRYDAPPHDTAIAQQSFSSTDPFQLSASTTAVATADLSSNHDGQPLHSPTEHRTTTTTAPQQEGEEGGNSVVSPHRRPPPPEHSTRLGREGNDQDDHDDLIPAVALRVDRSTARTAVVGVPIVAADGSPYVISPRSRSSSISPHRATSTMLLSPYSSAFPDAGGGTGVYLPAVLTATARTNLSSPNHSATTPTNPMVRPRRLDVESSATSTDAGVTTPPSPFSLSVRSQQPMSQSLSMEEEGEVENAGGSDTDTTTNSHDGQSGGGGGPSPPPPPPAAAAGDPFSTPPNRAFPSTASRAHHPPGGGEAVNTTTTGAAAVVMVLPHQVLREEGE